MPSGTADAVPTGPCRAAPHSVCRSRDRAPGRGDGPVGKEGRVCAVCLFDLVWCHVDLRCAHHYQPQPPPSPRWWGLGRRALIKDGM